MTRDSNSLLWLAGEYGQDLGVAEFPCLVLDGVVLFHSNVLLNLGFLLDSQLLFKELMATMTRGPFVQLCLVSQLHSFLDYGGPSHDHSRLSHLSVGLLQHTVQGAALKNHPEASVGSAQVVMGAPYYADYYSESCTGPR